MDLTLKKFLPAGSQKHADIILICTDEATWALFVGNLCNKATSETALAQCSFSYFVCFFFTSVSVFENAMEHKHFPAGFLTSSRNTKAGAPRLRSSVS